MSAGVTTHSGVQTAESQTYPAPTSATTRVLQSALVSATAVIFALVLVVLYANDIVIRFEYSGLIWNPNWFGLISGLVSIAVVGVWMPTRILRPADIMLYVLYCMVFIPAMVFPPVASNLTLGVTVAYQFTFVVCFLLLLVANRLPLLLIDIRFFSAKQYVVFLSIVTSLMALPVVYYYGLPTSLPSFADVYERRIASRDIAAAMPAVVGYLWFWLAKVGSPYLFVYGLVTKSKLLTATGAVFALYLYGLTGSKAVVFSVALLSAVLVFLYWAGRYAVLVIIPALATFIPIAYLLDRIFTDYWLTSLIARRTFIVPGILTGYFIEFFNDNPKIRWSNSFLAPFFDNPYGTALPPSIIGREYFLEHTSANAHFWADGFANWGLLGMMVVTIPTAVMIWLFNSVSVDKPLGVTVPLATLIGYTLANTAIFTGLLTHGIVIIIVLISLAPRDDLGTERGMVGADESANRKT